MKNLTIIGAGAWGTALASVFSTNFEKVLIWSYLAEEAVLINDKSENSTCLPGIKLQNIEATNSLINAVKDADVIISVIPSFAIRETWIQVIDNIKPGSIFINASKGIEKNTHLLPSQLFSELFKDKCSYFSLCGPSFAVDVAEKNPTAVILAGKDKLIGEDIISKLRTDSFHLRYSDDVIGTELGAVLKNVIAIASGMVLGKGYGPNTQALVVVEGINEMIQIGIAMGAKTETFLGLAGLGDLLLTAMNDKSRNMHFGMELGKGVLLEDALKHQSGVAEGYYTSFSLKYLLERYSLNLSLFAMMVDILINRESPSERFDRFFKQLF